MTRLPKWQALRNFSKPKVTYLSNLVLSFGVLNILLAIMAARRWRFRRPHLPVVISW